MQEQHVRPARRSLRPMHPSDGSLFARNDSVVAYLPGWSSQIGSSIGMQLDSRIYTRFFNHFRGRTVRVVNKQATQTTIDLSAA